MKDINLIFGDCFLLNDNIEDGSIDLIVTDPPYGMNFQSSRRKVKHKKIENDENLDWLDEWFVKQYSLLKANSHAYVFCSFHNVTRFIEASKLSGFELKNLLIWYKNNHGSGDLTGDYAPQYEFILFLTKGRRILNGKRISNVIRCPKTSNENHPTEKPYELIQLLVDKSSSVGEIVLDNFFGSGSTAIACHNLGRRFIGHEIDEERFKQSQKRLSMLLTQTKLF